MAVQRVLPPAPERDRSLSTSRQNWNAGRNGRQYGRRGEREDGSARAEQEDEAKRQRSVSSALVTHGISEEARCKGSEQATREPKGYTLAKTVVQGLLVMIT